MPDMAPAPTFVSVSTTEYRSLTGNASLGKVLGRNIERAAAFWALVFSALLVTVQPMVSYYEPITRYVPLATWAWFVGALSSSRVLALIVNGWWPITFQVRLTYSAVTLLTVWAVIAALSWVSFSTRGMIYPTVALGPLAASVELLCFLTLRTRLEMAKGARNVGHSAGVDGGVGLGAVAGVRERVGEAALQG